MQTKHKVSFVKCHACLKWVWDFITTLSSSFPVVIIFHNKTEYMNAWVWVFCSFSWHQSQRLQVHYYEVYINEQLIFQPDGSLSFYQRLRVIYMLLKCKIIWQNHISPHLVDSSLWHLTWSIVDTTFCTPNHIRSLFCNKS